MKKKILAYLLSMAMIMTIVPMPAVQAEGTVSMEEGGTDENETETEINTETKTVIAAPKLSVIKPVAGNTPAEVTSLDSTTTAQKIEDSSDNPAIFTTDKLTVVKEEDGTQAFSGKITAENSAENNAKLNVKDNTPFVITFRMKTDAVTSTNWLIGKMDYQFGVQIGKNKETNKMCVELYCCDSNDKWPTLTYNLDEENLDSFWGTWHEIMAVYTGKTFALYVDRDAADNSAMKEFTLKENTNNNFTIGYNANKEESVSAPFAGKFTDVKMYSGGDEIEKDATADAIEETLGSRTKILDIVAEAATTTEPNYTVATKWTDSSNAEVTSFEEGKAYTLTATLTAKDGYNFTEDSKPSVIKVGETESADVIAAVAEDGTTMTVTCTFGEDKAETPDPEPTPEETTIGVPTIELNSPKTGETLPDAKISEDPNLEISTSWYYGEEIVEDNKIAEAYKDYTACITVSIKDEAEAIFDSRIVSLKIGESTYEILGSFIKNEDNEENKKKVTFTYTFDGKEKAYAEAKENLKDAIGNAKKIVNVDDKYYTQGSWNTFASALTTANNLNDNSTEKTINEIIIATNALNKAIEDLVHEHTYEIVWGKWTAPTEKDPEPSIEASCKCKYCDAKVENIGDSVSVNKIESIDATCTETGKKIYQATVSIMIDGKEILVENDTSEKYELIVEKEKHEYADALTTDKEHIKWSWEKDEKDNYTATLIRICKKCNHAEFINATVEKSTNAANCEDVGENTYIATVKIDAQTYTNKWTETISATGHSYGTPKFDFTKDENTGNYTATATFTCKNCSYEVTKNVETEKLEIHQTKAPTCTVEGERVLIATINFEGVNHTGYDTVSIPATGHSYGKPSWTWTKLESGYQATATFACENCKDSQSVTASKPTYEVVKAATCTQAGTGKYVATVTFNDSEYTNTNEVIIPATGHSLKMTETPATKTSEGEITIKCQHCKYEEKYVTPKTELTVYLGQSANVISNTKNCNISLADASKYEKYFTLDTKTGKITTSVKNLSKVKIQKSVPVKITVKGKVYHVNVKLKIAAPKIKIIRKKYGDRHRYTFKYNIVGASKIQVRITGQKKNKAVNKGLDKYLYKPKSDKQSYVGIQTKKFTFEIVAYYGKGKKKNVSEVTKISFK